MNTLIKAILVLGLMIIGCSSCNKDLNTTPDEEVGVEFRGGSSIQMDFTMKTDNFFEPTEGTKEDMCTIDLVSLSIPTKEQVVSAQINEDGSFCFNITEHDIIRSRGNEGRGNGAVYKICNETTTITVGGETTTLESGFDSSSFLQLFQGLTQTDREKQNLFDAMVQSEEAAGSNIVIKGNAMTITKKNDDGSTSVLLYNLESLSMVSATTFDSEGNITIKTQIGYKCLEDGTVVPSFILNYTGPQSSACSSPIIKMNQVTLDNWSISQNN